MSGSVKMVRGYCGPRTRLSLVLCIINREVGGIRNFLKCENGARILRSSDKSNLSFASLTGKSEEYDVSRSVKMVRGYCGP